MIKCKRDKKRTYLKSKLTKIKKKIDACCDVDPSGAADNIDWLDYKASAAESALEEAGALREQINDVVLRMKTTRL